MTAKRLVLCLPASHSGRVMAAHEALREAEWSDEILFMVPSGVPRGALLDHLPLVSREWGIPWMVQMPDPDEDAVLLVLGAGADRVVLPAGALNLIRRVTSRFGPSSVTTVLPADGPLPNLACLYQLQDAGVGEVLLPAPLVARALEAQKDPWEGWSSVALPLGVEVAQPHEAACSQLLASGVDALFLAGTAMQPGAMLQFKLNLATQGFQIRC